MRVDITVTAEIDLDNFQAELHALLDLITSLPIKPKTLAMDRPQLTLPNRQMSIGELRRIMEKHHNKKLSNIQDQSLDHYIYALERAGKIKRVRQGEYAPT